ncbi:MULTISPECIES: aromatic ring-hydroxylating dioxygenase subunit alpha [unclassified Mesorhizobium]|uniref:aromatic ring-hydroxylating oxygenase subunit alpha n=1 Tax=unclassified Mesorhizobium TaxID=325217 RepID=UPI000FD2F93E|nr:MULTISPECIES: aromatic ring-hydroxylating dioxygenase subunit alpha [unclassified Mesorhizobium]RUU87202.1 aromatic ring-hydroxylating dioxygenase subunit alpha [Mesorhizobium sp. M7A.F.Ca.MR.176.00.0.0]RWO62796.1 MAG: aromatic ring-hydroxylating dioxygenase subunit alpha [Mesorhizobium sp.]RWO80413.1 MAG: aromatic ring-hydroxylating dioxygenase subunit alpha [Mesorhizobium sp.]RWP92820.1 MAG: aromatic ring-hydroxylating dioxygenase subunit alpha [Mesorhizobium sp.]RWQ14334.1 MAG: aromatic 
MTPDPLRPDQLPLDTPPVQYLNLDPSLYVRDDIWQQERCSIFAHTWQFMGPVASVATSGQYLAIDIAGTPIFAIRGRDGTLRGFKNVCRHRGAKLLADGAGKCGLIVCPYHKWSFADTGRLVQAPWYGKDPAIIAEDWPLETVQLSEWRGLLFAALDPKESLLDQLGSLPDELADEPLETYAATDQATVSFTANWKIYTDNFVEGYHIPGTHPSFYAAIDFEAFQTTAHPGYVRMTAPPKDGLFYRGKWLWMWPNWTLSLFDGGMNVSRINPTSPHHTDQHYHFFFADIAAETSESRAKSVQGTLAVVREDYAICADTHRNYAAGAYSSGPLSGRHERGVQYFQERVAAALGL